MTAATVFSNNVIDRAAFSVGCYHLMARLALSNQDLGLRASIQDLGLPFQVFLLTEVYPKLVRSYPVYEVTEEGLEAIRQGVRGWFKRTDNQDIALHSSKLQLIPIAQYGLEVLKNGQEGYSKKFSAEFRRHFRCEPDLSSSRVSSGDRYNLARYSSKQLPREPGIPGGKVDRGERAAKGGEDDAVLSPDGRCNGSGG